MGMGATKRFWDHLNPTATTGGTTTAYTLTYTVAPQQLWNKEIYSFIINATCGAAPTLNINALGAKSIRKWTGAAWTALSAGDLVTDQFVAVYYNSGGSGSYDIIAGLAAGAVGIAGGSLAGTYPNPTFATARVSSVVLRKYTANDTYTPTAGMLYCVLECVGGGGAGGGSNGLASQVNVGGGGGSGSYSRIISSAADIGVSKAVTIGAGGTAGAAGANAGGNGGDTSVGTICIGKGGTGGGGTDAGVTVGSAGAGGVAGTGNVTAAGASGNSGFTANTTAVSVFGAAGGSSIYGGGAAPAAFFGTGSANGTAASSYGSGGAGGYTSNVVANVAGGAGSAGIVVITEYIGTT